MKTACAFCGFSDSIGCVSSTNKIISLFTKRMRHVRNSHFEQWTKCLQQRFYYSDEQRDTTESKGEVNHYLLIAYLYIDNII